MKRKFLTGVVGVLTITALLFTGCARGEKGIRNNKQQTSATSTPAGSSTVKKDVKNITDSELLKTVGEDEAAQLDSVDGQSSELSSDEIDSLLNDNSELNNIPSNFSVK